MTITSFQAFGLADRISRALNDCKFETPTPIQAQAIPPQLLNRDLLALAQTGTGKTAAFVLPMLQALSAGVAPKPRTAFALILAPTRELAVQIDQDVAMLGRHLQLRRSVVLGGVARGPQIGSLRTGVHVLVATPGRLLDLVRDRAVDLSETSVFVIDEADRMFDMGFIRDVRTIVSHLPAKRRTALFSATMPPDIASLAKDLLTDPVRVDVSPKVVTVDRIRQSVVHVPASTKQTRLNGLLENPEMSRVIVFTRTKRGADRVAERLVATGVTCEALHGNKSQGQRQRALQRFSRAQVRVLVATDIAARGIDIDRITHVVNYELPNEPETYVHRIGRTARNGHEGIAITLCDPSERSQLRAIEKLIRRPIDLHVDATPQGESRVAVAAAAEPNVTTASPPAQRPYVQPERYDPASTATAHDIVRAEPAPHHRASTSPHAGNGPRSQERHARPEHRRSEGHRGQRNTKPWSKDAKPGAGEGDRGPRTSKPWTDRGADRGSNREPHRDSHREVKAGVDDVGQRKPWANRDDAALPSESRPRNDKPSWSNRDAKPGNASSGSRKPWSNKVAQGTSGADNRSSKPWSERGSERGSDRGPNRDAKPGNSTSGERKPWSNRGPSAGAGDGGQRSKSWANKGGASGASEGGQRRAKRRPAPRAALPV